MCNLQLEQIYFTYECRYYCCCCCVAVWFFIYRVSSDTRWWYINWLRWLDANTQLGQTLISFQAEIKSKQLFFSKKTLPCHYCLVLFKHIFSFYVSENRIYIYIKCIHNPIKQKSLLIKATFYLHPLKSDGLWISAYFLYKT